jgi:glycosyltransferase involved in cell wall biosynthesis
MMLSVILCTHNPRPAYLQKTLEALRQQTLPSEQWECILVDNQNLPPLAEGIDLSRQENARVVREEMLGLTPARLRGIREAAGDLLVFVDDDNVLDPDYLEVAVRIAEERPYLGSWSGQCRPHFEEPPPEWTRRYWGNLVIREFDRDVWSNLPRLADTMPCGAGLCVRRSVARQYLQLHETSRRFIQLDRTRTSLLSGGDNDLAACACDIGLGMGIIASLRLMHLIPPERLTEDYLARLAEGIYLSGTILDYLRIPRAEFALYRVRWRQYLRALLVKRPHRRIQLACLKGRAKGLKFVEGLRTGPA